VRYVVALGRALALAVAGVVVGVAAVVVHGLTTGLVLALAATAAAAVALPTGWTWRVPFGVGWCAVVGVAAEPRGSGSYLVASNPRGWTLLGGAFVLLLFSLATAARRTADRRARPAAESGSGPPVS
jgi:hypothetical protein